MTCRQVVALVTEYLEGNLSEADRRRFDEHLQGCRGCTTYLAQMRTTLSLLGRLDAESLPANVRQELVRAFRDWKAS